MVWDVDDGQGPGDIPRPHGARLHGGLCPPRRYRRRSAARVHRAKDAAARTGRLGRIRQARAALVARQGPRVRFPRLPAPRFRCCRRHGRLSGRSRRSAAATPPRSARSLSPHDGQLLASGSNDNTVRVWNVAAGQLVKTLRGHGGRVRAVAFTPGGRARIAGSSRADTTSR